MRWADVSLDREWSIPKEAREKDTAGALVQLAVPSKELECEKVVVA
jgi:hypothetical protein